MTDFSSRWYNLFYGTRASDLSATRRCRSYERSPDPGTAIRTCVGVRLKFALPVPDLYQVRDFLYILSSWYNFKTKFSECE